MDDQAILDLYFDRSESAISETAVKYGPYCFSIAYNILFNNEDAEESVSDTYLAAWNAIPPRRPNLLAAFLAKITRRLSIDRWRARSAYKRGGGEMDLALEELDYCLTSGDTPELTLQRKELLHSVNRFLENLPEQERSIFLCRYWYLDPIDRIAENFGFTSSKVTSLLHRLRGRLRAQLQKEGY